MLELEAVNAYYGKSHVLHGVDFTVARARSSPCSAATASDARRRSRRSWARSSAPARSRSRAARSAGCKTHQVARCGLGYVPENRDIFPQLTVRENLLLGMKSTVEGGRWRMADMFELFPRLKERADTPGGVLSGGEQQMLTICRTLMGDPDLIMIDEPTEGLAPKMVELVADLLELHCRARRCDSAGRAEADDRAADFERLLRDGARAHRVRGHRPSTQGQ